jgi:SAM-dependent methyltransferase
VASGSGQGLGYLSSHAKTVIGGDFSDRLVREARRYYCERVPVIRLDAHALPFRNQSFDTVILYEAIYYLANPGEFLGECRRVLRDRGTVLICSVNNEWSDFNPSPFSQRYFSATELAALLRSRQFEVDLYAGFPIGKQSTRGKFASLLKRVAVALGLMPKTMKGKEFLKRIFLGKLVSSPAEIRDGMVEEGALQPVPVNVAITDYKVIFAVGSR